LPMDLFQSIDIRNLPGTPLPEKMRPREFLDLVGQDNVIKQLQGYIQSQYLPNMILWGPPGTGKTSFARIISQHFECDFIALNAVQSGAKELREISEKASQKRIEHHLRTILFVDEVHRFNKAQQDVLLPFIESGAITLVGATTENPSYELNKAILSRCRILVFEKIATDGLLLLLQKGLKAQGLETHSVFQAESLNWFLSWADGDARRMYLALEEIIVEYQRHGQALSQPKLSALLGALILGHDKSSDSHYDLISAMIKSIRGSDADAALYYLARLIKGGEDPVFIARRLVILASEDVGNADPKGIQIAINCAQAVEMVGLPEGGINLAQAVTYLSCAPKSNRSYLAFKQALKLVEQTGSAPVPLKLRSSQAVEMKNLGYGQDYLYPHDYPKHWTDQRYLPSEIELKEKLYQPAEIGYEKHIQEYLKWLKGAEENKTKV